VTHEQDRPTFFRHISHLAEALLLECRISNGEHLVHDEDLGLEVSRDGEGKPDLHPARVSLDRGVEEAFHLGELDDLVEAFVDVRSTHPEYRPVEVDVLLARQLGVEAGAHLQQRSDRSAKDRAPLGGLRDSGQQLEQRGLSCPVPPDDPHGLPLFDFERHVLHRPEILLDRRSFAAPE
jgi:hypothetical protein